MDVRDIARLLPAVFQQTLVLDDPAEVDLLTVLLQTMGMLHEPTEMVLADLDRYFTPYGTPDEFVFYLASWLDLAPLFMEPGENEPHFAPGVGRLRELLGTAVELANRRGTHGGLQKYLTVATGITGFTIEEDPYTPFHIVVGYPAAAVDYRPLIQRIVELEKPAYVSYQLQQVG